MTTPYRFPWETIDPRAHGVARFMQAIKNQRIPPAPTLDGYPFELRAKLIIEEALEAVRAHGFECIAAVQSDGEIKYDLTPSPGLAQLRREEAINAMRPAPWFGPDLQEVPVPQSAEERAAHYPPLAESAIRERMAEAQMAEIVDANFDLVYVADGSTLALGADPAELYAEGQASNLAKLTGPQDPVTGKQLKPGGWRKPDFRKVLRERLTAFARLCR